MTEKELIDAIKAEVDYLYSGGQNIRSAKHALIRATKAYADSREKTSREQFEARINLLQETNDAKGTKIEHLMDSRELARKQRNDYEKQLIESRSQIYTLNAKIESLQTLVDTFLSPQDIPENSTWVGDMSNSFDKWLRILKKDRKITIREDGGSPSWIWLTEGQYESDWFCDYTLNEVIDWVSTRGGLEFLSPIDAVEKTLFSEDIDTIGNCANCGVEFHIHKTEPAKDTKQFSSLNFKELTIGDEFYCYGDIFINYDYPKWCRCVKMSEDEGVEVDGISFFVGNNDKVFIEL